MAKRIFTLSLLLMSVFVVNAQLKVESSGNVTISKNVGVNGANAVDSIGVNIKVPSSSSLLRKYGLYSSIQAVPSILYGMGCSVGVFGEITPTGVYVNERNSNVYRPFQAGVVGVAASGIGVYGSTTTPLPRFWTAGTYAGYFSGNIKVTGSVTATSVNTTSDSRLKNNISSLNNEMAGNIVSQLRPVSYTLRNDTNNVYLTEDSVSTTHYGLVAQELQHILPELVSKDGAGYLSINYIELIPILVQVVQNQQHQISSLQQELTELKSK